MQFPEVMISSINIKKLSKKVICRIVLFSQIGGGWLVGLGGGGHLKHLKLFMLKAS